MTSPPRYVRQSALIMGENEAEDKSRVCSQPPMNARVSIFWPYHKKQARVRACAYSDRALIVSVIDKHISGEVERCAGSGAAIAKKIACARSGHGGDDAKGRDLADALVGKVGNEQIATRIDEHVHGEV